jgi:subtilisin family serine protease
MRNNHLKKTLLLYFFVVVFIFSCNTTKNSDLFYYGTNEKVILNVQENKLFVKFSQKLDEKQRKLQLEQIGRVENLTEQTAIITFSDVKILENSIEKLKNQDDIVSVYPLYITKDKQEMGVADEICLEFNKNIKETDKRAFFEKFKSIEIIPKNAWEKYFTIISIGKDQNALEIANRIKETGLVKYAHPNFYAITYKHSFFPNDQFFSNQFYLNNTGQATNDGHFGTADADIDAPEAWDITKGVSTITVAVLDEGVETTHPDLPTTRLTILNGSNFASGNANDPDAAGDGAHGTCCAGIIGAEQNNSQGVSGIAPLCKIMPIRIPFGSVASTTYANAINFAWSNGADVLSNSWGYNSTADIPVITASINNAITMGRGGVGSVVVWSAGNTADHVGGNIGYVSFPGNVAVANVITVGASDRNDQQANYSPTGTGVDIVASSHRAYSCQIPGESFEVWTTDIAAGAGYNATKNTDCSGSSLPVVGALLPATGSNFQDYTGRMGGTSSSCPEAAGVAALILSINPTFTPAQVFNRITSSADKVGGYTYSAGRCNEMGFGRLNAHAALSGQLWMKDTPNDPGTEPNPTTDLMYISEDIIVRKTNDAILIHEDAEYKVSSPNAVYVRVRNSGTEPTSGTLKLYWAKASTGLSWNAPWDGSVLGTPLMGGIIGTLPTGIVPANGEKILQLDWFPPDPALYSSFGTNQFHFCLLARIETTNSAPFGMTFPEVTGDLWGNVKNNNNIVWKNMSVRDNVAGNSGTSSGMLIANYSRKEELTRIVFSIPRAETKLPLFKYGDLIITMSDKLFTKWKESVGKSDGIRVEGKTFKITSPNVWLGDFIMKPNEIYGLQVQYKMNSKPETGNQKDFVFNFDVQQMAMVNNKWQIKGGERYQYYPDKQTKYIDKK